MLRDRISQDMKEAMKSGDKAKLSAIRNIHAAIRKKEIDERIDLDDAAALKVIASLVKQRQDSIEQFKAGNRQDLVEKEGAELALLQSYMPAQMSTEELVKLVEAAIQECNAKTQKEMGAVMKIVMPKVAGRADGKVLNQLIRERLS